MAKRRDQNLEQSEEKFDQLIKRIKALFTEMKKKERRIRALQAKIDLNLAQLKASRIAGQRQENQFMSSADRAAEAEADASGELRRGIHV